MKNYWTIPLTIGLVALLLFPNPEQNFGWYILTMILTLVGTISAHRMLK